MLLARLAASSSSASNGSGGFSLEAYAGRIATAVAVQDGSALSKLFSLKDNEHIDDLLASLPRPARQYINSGNDTPHLQDFKRWLANIEFGRPGTPTWTTMASKHLAALLHMKHHVVQSDDIDNDETGPSWNEVYAAQQDLVKAFLSWFSDASLGPAAWSLPVLYVICRELKTAAIKADEGAINRQEKPGKLEESSRLLTKCWAACMNDRSAPVPGSLKRQYGTYYMAILLFKIYFRLDTLNLCKNVLRGIHNQHDLPALSSFPKAHRVSYYYYVGLYEFLNERYSEADAHLTTALQICHRKAHMNQKRILTYLIPLRMLRGVLPAPIMFGKYPELILYQPFAHAYCSGDVQKYDRQLLQCRAALVDRGTFLIMEQAREGCLRTLFKKVWLYSNKTTRLSLGAIQRALTYADTEVDTDEVECLLANLIHKGHLRGYISHEKQTIVVARDNAFPSLAGRAIAA